MSDGLRLVSCCLSNTSARAILETPMEMFQDDEVAVVEFVKRHFRMHRELPQARTVREETGVRLPDAPEAILFYEERVHERYEYNQVRHHFGGLREGIAEANMTAVADSVSAMHRAIRQRQRRGLESMNLAEAWNSAQSRMDRTVGYGGVTGIETGWSRYDDITGGYQNGDLVSIVGRPSLGKTYVLLKIAHAAHLAGRNVLVVTTEMPAEQIARRHASLALGVNPTYLRMNTISTYMRRRLSSFYRDMAGADGFRIFTVGMKGTTASVEAFMQEYDPDLVLIDGAYLMRPAGQGKNMSRTEKVASVFDEIKALTLEANKPIVVTSQFNRTAGKAGTDGSLENIGFTDAISTHSSIVNSIQPGPTENPMNSRYIGFLKGREGESGRVAINFKFAPTDLSDFDPDQDPGAEAGSPESVAATNVDWMQ